jgi:hypothetical protein
MCEILHNAFRVGRLSTGRIKKHYWQRAEAILVRSDTEQETGG